MRPPSARYAKIVEWSEHNGKYMAGAPGLICGAIYGDDEQALFIELCTLVDKTIAEHMTNNKPLPEPMVGLIDSLLKGEMPLEPTPAPYYWQFVEPYWEKTDIYSSRENFLRDYSGLPEPVKHLLSTTWCQSEICNGGLHQFFGNSTGVLAPEAAIGFEALGTPKLAATLREAMAFFGDVYPGDCEERDKLLGKYARENPTAWNPFEKLDEQFYMILGGDLHTQNSWELAADDYAKRIIGDQQ